MIKRNTEVADIVVLGGGAAGVMAAAAAARNGANVLLVESQNCLGGSRTATGVDTFYGFYTPGEHPRKVVGGIPDEIVERLRRENKLFERQNTYGAGTGLTYDVEALKIAYEDLVMQAGCRLLFHTTACHVEAADGRVNSVWLANKAGLTEVKAAVFVDTTGDADIVARAGGGFNAGSEAEPNQSLSTIFFMGNVDLERAAAVSHREMAERMKEANRRGKFTLPREDGSYHRTPNPGVIQANMVRVKNIDATDPFALTKAELEGRKQVQQYAAFLKSHIPGFESAFLIGTSQYIGVRESRKIEGHYTLTEDDVISGRKFSDSIACCGAPVEDHHPGEGTRWAYVSDGGHYHIPFRCLIPVALHNVVVAGRCLSATHGAQASARNSAQSMAMGQAAGTAAALAAKDKTDFADLDIDAVRRMLTEQYAIID
ncbi:FAD-dependent oxidoreductase [Paenibacillus alkaliterrae]|uniref:FAD-dependent oxidoreductase n=1 Tax=Paenibacillus alkaliterrae TaxID=320909 RepID=UPI001F2EF436|nr:FAD-dependent oxidoreductase [Paenibacillus alkaliterrae]MCF2937827.1 FAD-dependent oxidoreductase [Paenibacillus alkaliterrae]